ncbi:hypothetical protein EXIGLDRAFT_453537 [Exidia glandulosa HHB12029]|uniref:Uncharacterized protein n=1 Tax=Exidia glandulosa HHB12029 TaxID=1314781 RepID=A0A165B304_EXIGL|nr:hypothetical protein EXIGLDRAFT_453537 [Exidia glandulosa HHB12029]
MSDTLSTPATSRPVTPLAEASSRRYNSLYDLTSLRLHPDGLRVLPGDRIWRGSSFHSAAPVKDSRGNIFASDAGGRSKLVRKRQRSSSRSASRERKRRASDASASEFDHEDFQVDLENEGSEDGMNLDDDLKDRKAKMRRDFCADYSFLDEAETAAAKEREEMKRLYHPSSDLMKYIHYYATKIYDKSGELFDATIGELRPDRPRKRFRAASGSTRTASPAPPDLDYISSPSSTSSSSSPSEDEDAAAVDEQDQDDVGLDDGRVERLSKWKKRTGRKVGRPRTTGISLGRGKKKRKGLKVSRNMFRAFDGSALLCIGLLVQEHVAKLIDQPLRLSLDAELEAMEDEELHWRYTDVAATVNKEEVDPVEREAQTRLESEGRR